MKKIFIIVLLFVVASPIMAKGFIPKGYIIYPSDSGLIKLDLSTLSTRRIFTLPIHCNISNISKAGKNSIVFYAYLFKNTKNELIYELNLKTKKVKTLSEGYAPTFIQSQNGLYYYSTKNDYLYFKNIRTDQTTKIGPSQGVLGSDYVIPLSDHTIIYVPPQSSGKDAMILYNLSKRSSKALHIPGCSYPLIWRSTTKQLMCLNTKSNNTFLVNLNGSNKHIINVGGHPILYLTKTDQLLTSVPRVVYFTQHYDIYLYDFKTKKSALLKKNVMLGLNDAVYIQQDHIDK